MPKGDRRGQQRFDQHVAPIFGKEAGVRMSLVRMKMLMDQKELGEVLGISQQQVSALESGRMTQAPFTLARLKAVFDLHYAYILTGVRGETWTIEANYIRLKYYDFRHRVRRKPGSGLHRKRVIKRQGEE
jgi:transcriptional regulator with XRE-family HTH domain